MNWVDEIVRTIKKLSFNPFLRKRCRDAKLCVPEMTFSTTVEFPATRYKIIFNYKKNLSMDFSLCDKGIALSYLFHYGCETPRLSNEQH